MKTVGIPDLDKCRVLVISRPANFIEPIFSILLIVRKYRCFSMLSIVKKSIDTFQYDIPKPGIAEP